MDLQHERVCQANRIAPKRCSCFCSQLLPTVPLRCTFPLCYPDANIRHCLCQRSASCRPLPGTGSLCRTDETAASHPFHESPRRRYVWQAAFPNSIAIVPPAGRSIRRTPSGSNTSRCSSSTIISADRMTLIGPARRFVVVAVLPDYWMCRWLKPLRMSYPLR